MELPTSQTKTTTKIMTVVDHKSKTESSATEMKELKSSSQTAAATLRSHDAPSHVDTPPTSMDSEVEISTDQNRTKDKCQDHSDSGAAFSDLPSNIQPLEKVAKKLEEVKLDSTTQEASPTQKVSKHLTEEAASTLTESPQLPMDLYHLMQHTCGEGSMSRWLADFDPHKCGLEMLSKYIDAARGPLKGHGWEYSRAVKLMVELKKAAVATQSN